MKHVGFKSYPQLFDELENGRKTWDARFNDWADARHYELHFSSTMDAGPKQDVETITFVDRENYDRRITFVFDRLEFVDWAPNWSFLILGDRVETPTEIDFGPSGLAIDEHAVPAWARLLRDRWIGRVILAVGRWIVPKLIRPLPTRLQNVFKRALPCVFGAPVEPHVRCYCVAVFSVSGAEVRCGESYNSGNHHTVLGTHLYLAPDWCPHQAIDRERSVWCDTGRDPARKTDREI